MAIITTLVVITLGEISYHHHKNGELDDMRLALALDANQIAPSLELPVRNLDHTEINKIAEGMMQDPILQGIVLKLADNQTVICARERDAQGNIKVMEKELPAAGLLVEKRDITLSNKTLATITLLGTTKPVDVKAKNLLKWVIGNALWVESVLIVSLYLLIQNLVFKPLKEVEAYAAAVSAGGSTASVGTFRGELESLHSSLKKMVGQLEARYKQLEAEMSVRKRMEAELAQVSRLTMMGEVTASIAHEVNQPLAAVVTNAQAVSRWLAATPPNLDESREAVHRIARDGNRASEVIRRIRALVKKGEPARTPVNLNELVQETIVLTKPELILNKVTLQTELAPELPRVPADRVQLQQVLLNLVVNAVDSMSAAADRPRFLRIRTDHPEPQAVQVAVQDTGLGIKPDEAERLFEPFYTTKPHGLGMGLAISRSIVEAHGGRLWATPDDGRGVTFQFTLPVQEGGAS